MPVLTQADFPAFKAEAEACGLYWPASVTKFAMDSEVQPSLPANGGIPAIVSTFLDPEIVRTIFAPQKATDILGEKKKGACAQETPMAHIAYITYGDAQENGGSGLVGHLA